jgi:hypothetical protein
MGKKLLTLNIGASSVVLAEYDVGRKAPVLLKYGKATLAAPLDSGDASAILAPALHEIMRTKGIRPGKVALSLSGQAAFLRNAISEQYPNIVVDDALIGPTIGCHTGPDMIGIVYFSENF